MIPPNYKFFPLVILEIQLEIENAIYNKLNWNQFFCNFQRFRCKLRLAKLQSSKEFLEEFMYK